MVDFALEHMFRIALRMLFGDRTKYVTLVLGLAFAALLMNQQGAIFLGLLRLATGPLQNVTQNDLWVTDPDTPWIAEFRALPDQKLARVRSVAGVAWAEPFFNGIAVCELASGTFKRVQIIGISRSTLAGGPPEMIEGRIEDLWIPDAIVVERKSLERLGGAKVTGRVVHFHDERLSSVEADWKMARSGLTHGQKKARRDALAAAAILQAFLQTFGEGSRGYATDADAGEQDEDRGV